MKKITLEITGTVPLAGHRPGERFLVDAHDDGTPTELYWRKRLADEAREACGAMRVVPDDDAVAAPDPAPPAAPAPAKKRT